MRSFQHIVKEIIKMHRAKLVLNRSKIVKTFRMNISRRKNYTNDLQNTGTYPKQKNVKIVKLKLKVIFALTIHATRT